MEADEEAGTTADRGEPVSLMEPLIPVDRHRVGQVPVVADNRVVELKDRIVVDPEILLGKPVIAGTRISVELIIDLLASGWSHEQILANYPHLSDSDILACLQYAGELLHSERVYPMPMA